MNHSHSEHGLVRELGLTEALAIGLGTMVGAGIFVLSAIAAERAGPAAALSYVLAGLVCLPIAMIVSELATGMPQAGGSYHLISRALGPAAGAVVGPGNWLGLIFANSFYLLAFGKYFGLLVPVPPWAASLVAGLFFTWLNYRGAKVSGRAQNVIVAVLLVILALFVVLGVVQRNPALQRPFAPHGWEAVIVNVGLIIVSFTGFEKISTIAEEIKSPGRNLPLAIVGSVCIATLLYFGVVFATTGVLAYQDIGHFDAPLVEAARRMIGPVGSGALYLAALLATASSANAATMAASRINFAMGRDRILPAWFGELHPRFITPARSILFTGGLSLILAVTGQAEVLAEISSALFLVSYTLMCASCVVMRRSRPLWYRPAYRIPFYPWLPIVAGMVCLLVITTMEPLSQSAGVLLVLLSLAWYGLWARRQTPVVGEMGPMLQRERPLERVLAATEELDRPSGHEILVPVANPATVAPLIRLAAAIARAEHDTVVTALRLVTVPRTTPLSTAQRFAERRPEGENARAILRQVAELGLDSGVPVRPVLRAAYGVASGILALVRDRPGTQLVLMGRHGPLSLDLVRGSADKTVIREALCDAAVLQNRGLEQVRRVLVPVGGGPHARLGLQLASKMARGAEAELTVLRLFPAEGEINAEAEIRALRGIVQETLGEIDPRINTRVACSSDVVEGILAETRRLDYDLLVIGASEEWFFKHLLFGAIPDRVAEEAPCSVLLVRKYEPRAISSVRRILKRQWG
jgi:amino acid transporter/nucleotide-binding universal stress UspA family protein